MRNITLSILAGLAFFSLVQARTAAPSPRPHGRRFDLVYLAKNQWRMPITNYGAFGNDVPRNSAGGEWPRGSGNMYIFGAGIWFGRRTNNNADTNSTVGYNPNSGKSEFSPGAWDNAPSGYSSRDFERVYVYPEDWPPNPDDFPTGMRDSIRTSLKIPQPGGDTIFGWFNPIPRKAISTGDAWAVYNDRDPVNMEPRGKSIGIEVYQNIYAWSLPSNRDILFFSYNIKNVSADTIKDAYAGLACDGDIGGANNDFAGLILRRYVHDPTMNESLFVDNVGMEWSDTETGWPTFPGVLAFDFFQSPYKKDSLGRVPGIDGIDNNGNGLIDEPAEGEQLGMTSYKIFTLQAGDPAGDGKQYLALQGKEWWVTPPTYNPYDSLDNTPNDKRFLQATGPFSLAPDSMLTITVGCMAAPMSHLPSDRDTSFWRLAITDNAAQSVYNNNWLAPTPPPSPNFTLLPGDGRVTIMWDNFPESAKDPYYPLARTSDPFYTETDFQGYKVYRSQSGQVGAWTLLTQCDKRDGIVFEDTTVAESIRTKATDSGLFYAFVDSTNIRYGFPYFYAVTSFDYNTLGRDTSNLTHLTLESGMLPQAITTRTDPANFEPAQAAVRQTAGNPRLQVAIDPTVIAPQAIGYDTFRAQFTPLSLGAGNLPVYGFHILRPNGDTASPLQTFSINIRKFTDTVKLSASIFDSVVTKIGFDSARNETTVAKGWLPIMQVAFGIKMDSIPEQVFDSVKVASGAYPQTKFRFPATLGGSFYNYNWAYRGSNYRVAWKTAPNGKLTADVTDLTLGDPINFRLIPLLPARPESAFGWCFYDSLAVNRLRIPTDTLTQFRTRTMVINGSAFDLNRGFTVDDTLPAVGDTWYVFSEKYSPAPIEAVYLIETQPMKFRTEKVTLHVKTVPNPYLVSNEWERHPDFRKLKFINLPDHCTIRIYTMSGDLIRTITHDATNAGLGNIPNQLGGDEDWDLLSAAGQKPAPGIYIFHVESTVGNQVGRFAIVD